MHFIKSLYKTIYSSSFYGKAVSKGVKEALKNHLYFHLLITFFTSILFTIAFQISLSEFQDFLMTISSSNIGIEDTKIIGNIICLISPLVIFVGYIVGNFIQILIITVINWIFLSLLKIKNIFKETFIITLYAFIPVFYIDMIIALINLATERLLDFSIARIIGVIYLLSLMAVLEMKDSKEYVVFGTFVIVSLCVSLLLAWFIKWLLFCLIGYKGIKTQTSK